MITGLRTVNRYLLAGASVIGICAFGSPEAKAASDVQQLEAAMRAMQAQMQDLQRQVAEAKTAAAAAKASGGGKGDDLDLKIRWRGAPELSSADGKFKMKVRGRFQADYNAIDQDQRITGRPNVSAAEIRRARLGIEGVVFYDVEYKLEVDFANDEVALKDAYLAYTGLADGLSVLFGNFKTPNSIEEMTSSRFYTFMERSAFVDTFGLDRQIGAGATYAQKHFTLSGGVFGPLAENDEAWMKDVKTGAARVTLAPINNDTSVVHLGASWRERHGAEDLRSDPIPDEDQFFRYRARGADLHLADRFISTPQIFDRDTFWGVEGAVIWKSLYAVGEYTQLKADIARGFVGADPTYVGWYIEGGWFITGEMRTYNEGEFGRIKVKNPVFGGSRGWGAWQLAGKYDLIDLTDNATVITDCSMCGEQATWLIGVNWYLNDYTRMQFNYNESDIEGGFLDGANRNNGATIKGFGMRAQVDW